MSRTDTTDHCGRPLTGQLRELAEAALAQQSIMARRLRRMGGFAADRYLGRLRTPA